MPLSADLHSKVSHLLAQAEDVHLLQSTKQILNLLQEHGIAYQLQIKSRHVGTHPCNRDGYGINAHDVHDLVENIFAIGWDSQEVKAVCCELESNDTATKTWNVELASNSGGLLAPVVPDALKFVSLWGGHTNQGLRAIEAGIPHSNPDMTDGGKLSVEKIKLQDPLYADAICNGVKWLVIPAFVMEEFPNLAEIVQSAGNSAGQVAKSEHELQMLRKLYNAFMAESRRSGKVCFQDIKQRVLRSKPPCAGSVPFMYTFVLKCAGGNDPTFLRESELFIKANSPSTRVVSPELYDALAQDFKGPDQAVRFRHAVLKLAYTTQHNVVNNESRWVAASDAKRLGSKEVLPKVLIADGLINEMRKLASMHGISYMAAVDVLSTFEMDLVVFVMDKRHKDRKIENDSMATIAHKCVVALQALSGADIVSRWAVEASHTADSQEGSNTRMITEVLMRAFNSNAQLSNAAVMVVERGFKTGMQIFRRNDNVHAHIEEMNGETIVIRTVDGKAHVPIASFLKGEWIQFESKPVPQRVDNWLQSSPQATLQFAALVMQGRIMYALNELSQKHAEVLEHIDVFIKPKDVKATRQFDKNKLVLVPATLNVGWKAKGAVPAGSAPLGNLLTSPEDKSGVTFWLMPTLVAPKKDKLGFIAPFWLVQTTQDEACVNAEIVSPRGTDFNIPVIRNTIAVKPGDSLYVYIPKKEITATVEPIVTSAASCGQSNLDTDKPAKKARKGVSST
jgi:hypothetical protein